MLKNRGTLNHMQAYVPGKPIDDVKREFGITEVIKIASNENPYGCSRHVIDALKEAITQVEIYPDGNATLLKEAVATHLNIKTDQLLFGAGSDEIITFIANVFINPGDEVLSCTPSFPRYQSATQLMDGCFIAVPCVDYKYDLQGLIDGITDKTKVIFIANPNNPTGTMCTAEEQRAFLEQVPPHILVVADEAYFEYACESEDYPDTMSLLNEYKNLIILRTFSKAYGLASLRVGYAISQPPVIDLLNRVRGPFNVTSLAQKAALAALHDQAFVKACVSKNKEVKTYAYRMCDELGISYIKSSTNFIMMKTNYNAHDLFVKLQTHGIIIRPLGETNLIRVTLGTMDEMKKFFAEMKNLL